jgi:TRAP-type transport system periplasmic protein
MYKRSATALLAGAVALALGASAHAETTTLKMTTCLARNHDFTQAMFKTFLEPLNAKKGNVQIRYLGGPEVTPFQKQAPALKRGLVDMISCPAAYYGGILPEAHLPGVQNVSLEEIRKNGAWDMMQQAWGKGLNAHILSWTDFKAQVFYTYFLKKPKLSTKTGLDLTGLKMRTTGLYRPMLQAMGATTVVMAPSDVYAGLERGVVHGLAWPWGSIAKYGWERFIKYRVKPDFYGASILTLINLEKWKNLSKAQQDMLTQQARTYEKEGSAILVKKGEEDDAKLKKAGVEDLELKGDVRKAYLKTIYDAKWAENDKLKYTVDYKKLKSLLYQPGS